MIQLSFNLLLYLIDTLQPVAPLYATRNIACKLCGGLNVATTVQLWYRKGYRTLHCTHWQTYSSVCTATCARTVGWHACPTHPVDPITHTPRRGIKHKSSAQSSQAFREESLLLLTGMHLKQESALLGLSKRTCRTGESACSHPLCRLSLCDFRASLHSYFD